MVGLQLAAAAEAERSRFVFGQTPNERSRFYLQQVLTGRDAAKEVRAFGLGGYLRGRYERLWNERLSELRAVTRRRLARSLGGSLVSGALSAGTIAVLAW